MNDEIKVDLIVAGMDVNDAMNRFMNNDSMLEKFLKKFMEDNSYNELVEAVADGNNDKAFRASHTLKGVAAYFSFVKLRTKASEACEEFRVGNFTDGAGMLPEISEAYEEIIEVLTRYYSE